MDWGWDGMPGFRHLGSGPRVLGSSWATPDCTGFYEEAAIHKKTISLRGLPWDRNCRLMPVLPYLHVNMDRMYNGIQTRILDARTKPQPVTSSLRRAERAAGRVTPCLGHRWLLFLGLALI